MRNRPDSGGAGAFVNPSSAVTPPPPAVNNPTPNLNSPNSANPYAPNAGSPGFNDGSNNNLNGTPASTPISSGGELSGVGGVTSGTPIAVVQWQSQNQVAVGGTVAVGVLMQASQGVDSVPMTLGYDNTKLQVVGVTEGPFLRHGGSPTSFSSRITSNGQVMISDTSASSVGATASAVFATVTFRALAATAATDVQVVSVAPLGVNGVVISAVPPTPLVLQVTQP